MAFKGFTWNLDENGAEILLTVLDRYAKGRCPTGIDEHIAGLYCDSLRRYLAGADHGKGKKAKDRADTSAPTSLDRYRDCR